MDKLTITVKELAQQLNIGKNAAYELCHKADFPVIRISERHMVIPVDGLREWLKKNTETESQA